MTTVEKYHVEPGGPEITFLAGGLEVTKLSVGPTDNNAYVIAAPMGPVVLVDCAAEADRLMQAVGHRTVGIIVTTHQHPDHIRVLAAMSRRTGARLVCGEPDRAAIEERTGTEQDGVWDGDTVSLGDVRLGVIGLVGHTPGSITLVIEGGDGATHLLTGDSIFPGGLGKTLTPEQFDSLYTDVVGKVFDRFDDATVIHPGHGDSTTVGAERPHLGEWRTRGW